MKNKPAWITYILRRIKKNKNFLGVITGPTGSGKSWSALSIAYQLDPGFNIERVVFNLKDLMALVNSGKLKPGSVILFDEAGVELDSRTWQSVTNRVINYLIQTFRHKNFILLFTAPYSDFVDTKTKKLFHAEFQTCSINRREQTTLIKPKLLQYNADMKKWYYHYLGKMVEDVGMVKIKRWAISKPPEELINQYEQAKTDFTTKLNLEIEATLNKIDPNKRKPLTEIQEADMRAVANNGYQKAAEIRGKNMRSVFDSVKLGKKKGYTLEEFKEKAKCKQIA